MLKKRASETYDHPVDKCPLTIDVLRKHNKITLELRNRIYTVREGLSGRILGRALSRRAAMKQARSA